MTETFREFITPDNPELNAVLVEEASNRLMFIKQDDIKLYFDGREFMPAILANRLTRDVFFPGQLVSFASEAGYESWRYVPEQGIYVEDVGCQWLNRIIKNVLGDASKRSRISDVIYNVQIETAISREEFQQPPHILVLQNGVYDFSDGTLHDFSPAYHATAALPVAYNPYATCPEIDNYLEGAEPTWTETGADATQALIEYTSYTLYNGFPIHRFLIIFGEQGTGKSTFIKLVSRFIGKDNHSSVPLQDIDSDQYAKAEIYKKLANMSADLSSKALKSNGFLKMTTGGDEISANRKYMGRIEFEWTGKHIFSCNEVPASYDISNAYHIRVMLVGFPNIFRGTDKDDQNLIDKLITPEELSGLLNKCLRALPELLDRGCFKNEPSLEQRKLNYLKLSDTAAFFIETQLEPDQSATVTSNELYQAYRRMCLDELKTKPKSHDSLSKTMGRVTPFGYPDTEKVEGRSTRVWRGIKIKNAPPKPKTEPTKMDKQVKPKKVDLDTKNIEDDEAMIFELTRLMKTLGGQVEYIQAEAHLKKTGFTVEQGSLPRLARNHPYFTPFNSYKFMLTEEGAKP